MGKISPTSNDHATSAISGAFTSATTGAAFNPAGSFNVSVWGTFVGTVTLKRSFDGGTTYISITDAAGTANAYTAPFSLIADELESGVLYRLECTAFTSGTISWRLSQ